MCGECKQAKCANCHRTDAKRLVRGLCDACNEYLRRHGEPRPELLWNRPTKCKVCGASEKLVLGRCELCYRYYKRTGTERPLSLDSLVTQSNIARKRQGSRKRRKRNEPKKFERLPNNTPRPLCADCKEEYTNSRRGGKYCDTCANYRYRTGKKRPRWMVLREKCRNCKAPLNGYKTIYGRCRLCSRYYYAKGVERPASVYNAPHGWCDCGDGWNPVRATHSVAVRVMHHDETMPLCDDCYAEHQRQVRWYGSPDITTKGNIQPKRRTAHSAGDD